MGVAVFTKKQMRVAAPIRTPRCSKPASVMDKDPKESPKEMKSEKETMGRGKVKRKRDVDGKLIGGDRRDEIVESVVEKFLILNETIRLDPSPVFRLVL